MTESVSPYLQRPVRKLEEVDPGAKPAPNQTRTHIDPNSGLPPSATAADATDDGGR